jgi:polyisoprenoid-binding protein YceI
MKKIVLTSIALVALVLSINAQSTWKVDNSHSSINFSVSHFMISEVTGHFGSFDITTTANEKFENPTFDVTIDASTINTNQSDRDNHLKSPDFFNVEKHKNIAFKSSSFKQLEDGAFEVSGKITINGVTKDAVFSGKLNGVIKDDQSGKHLAGLKLTTIIEREDFNLGNGMSPIGKEVTVTINIEMYEE